MTQTKCLSSNISFFFFCFCFTFVFIRVKGIQNGGSSFWYLSALAACFYFPSDCQISLWKERKVDIFIFFKYLQVFVKYTTDGWLTTGDFPRFFFFGKWGWKFAVLKSIADDGDMLFSQGNLQIRITISVPSLIAILEIIAKEIIHAKSCWIYAKYCFSALHYCLNPVGVYRQSVVFCLHRYALTDIW